MRFLLAATFALGVSCGPPPVITNNNCCTPTSAQRGFGYASTYAGDGGVSTQVQLIIGVDGIATVTFIRGSDQVIEKFQTVPR